MTEPETADPPKKLVARCREIPTHLRHAFRAIPTHVRRALAWNIRGVKVGERENALLIRRQALEPTLQCYLSWRRSCLIVLAAPALLVAICTTFDMLTSDYQGLSTIGWIWIWTQILVPYSLPVAVIAANFVWTRYRLSGNLLLTGWLIWFIVPLFLFLCPAHLLFDPAELGAETEQARANLEKGIRVFFGLFMSLSLVAYFILFLSALVMGTQRGCLRLKTLFPKSVLPGWLLVGTSPLFPLLLFPVFVLFHQLAASPLLLVGTGMTMCASLIYVVFAKTMIQPMDSPGDFRKVGRIFWASRIISWIGTLAFLIYAFTKHVYFPTLDGGHQLADFAWADRTLLGFDISTSFYRPWSWRVIRWTIELYGRMLLTMILLVDLVIRVTTSMWYHQRVLEDAGHTMDHDLAMSEFRQFLSDS